MLRKSIKHARLALALLFVLSMVQGAGAVETPYIVTLKGIWRHTNAIDRDPQQAKFKDVNVYEQGTYKSFPYYYFLEGKPAGTVLLITDGTFTATLKESNKQKSKNVKHHTLYDVSFDGSESTNEKKFTNVTLSVNDPSCAAEHTDGCFVVHGTTDNFSALKKGLYVRSYKTPDPHNKSLDVENPFVAWPADFKSVTNCYDLSKVDPNDLTQRSCFHDLFAGPEAYPTAYNERQFGAHKLGIPIGWQFDLKTHSEGGHKTYVMSTSQDVMTSVRRALGYHVAASAGGGVSGIFSVEANFSFKKDTATSKRIDNMYAQELTYSQNWALLTKYALVVDKQNIILSNDFYQAIRALKPTGFDAFIRKWGTHYAYATTFGAKGSRFDTYSKSQTQSLIDAGVDVGEAWSAGISTNILKLISAEVEGGSSFETAKEQAQKLEQFARSGLGEWSCIGDFACREGKPEGLNVAPMFVDLRPISELLGPPFFTDAPTAITLRKQLEEKIKQSVYVNSPYPNTPSTRFARITLGQPSCPGCTNFNADGITLNVSFSNGHNFPLTRGKSLIVDLPKAPLQTQLVIKLENGCKQIKVAKQVETTTMPVVNFSIRKELVDCGSHHGTVSIPLNIVWANLHNLLNRSQFVHVQ